MSTILQVELGSKGCFFFLDSVGLSFDPEDRGPKEVDFGRFDAASKAALLSAIKDGTLKADRDVSQDIDIFNKELNAPVKQAAPQEEQKEDPKEKLQKLLKEREEKKKNDLKALASGISKDAQNFIKECSSIEDLKMLRTYENSRKKRKVVLAAIKTKIKEIEDTVKASMDDTLSDEQQKMVKKVMNRYQGDVDFDKYPVTIEEGDIKKVAIKYKDITEEDEES